MQSTVPIAEKLESIAGSANVRTATAQDLVAGQKPEYIVSPGSEQEVAAVLAFANEVGISVIPRGGGTKLEWGNPPRRADIILSTARLNRVLEHAWADLTVTVEAGCTLQSLQSALAQHGQRLALDALWPERATIGGVLSSNDSGALRLRFGALRDLIIGATLALPDGTLAKSGGKVVKNVAGYDLPKLATGALGTLGVITRAVFRLHPLCRESLTLTFSTASIEEMQDKVLGVQDSQLAHTAFQIWCADGHAPEADILFEATPAGLRAQQAKLQDVLGGLPLRKSEAECWLAKQHLWDALEADCAIAKITTLPANFAETILAFEEAARLRNLKWKIVLQATGIGWLRLDGAAASLTAALEHGRSHLEARGGSLVLLHRTANMDFFDAWGSPGDALALMRALKHRLDPKGILNPGRFVGGI